MRLEQHPFDQFELEFDAFDAFEDNNPVAFDRGFNHVNLIEELE